MISDNNNSQTSALSQAIVDPEEANNDEMHHHDRTKCQADRNHDIASAREMEGWTWVLTFAMLIAVFFPLFVPNIDQNIMIAISLVLVLLWGILLIRDVPMTKWHVIIFIIMGASFVAFSAFSWHPIRWMLAALACAITLMQIASLVEMLRSTVAANTKLQSDFFQSFKVLYVVSTVSSILFVWISLHTWPSTLSVCFAATSLFAFVHASWVGSKVAEASATAEARNSDKNHAILFSCDADYMDDCEVCCTPYLPIMLIMVVLMILYPTWPLRTDARGDSPILQPATFFILFSGLLGSQAQTYQVVLNFGRRLYVRADASILVETLSRTYVYDKAIRAYLGPNGVRPQQTDLCHVYCRRETIRKVVVELTQGRSLCLTPDKPMEFVDAITRALEHSHDQSILTSESKEPAPFAVV
jgi:hypothetical protein